MKTLQRNKSVIMKKIMYVTLVGLLIMQLTSCDKDTTNDNQSAKLTVLMTDAPANYDEVLIDVQGVEVTGNGGSAVMLNTTAKVYNLLELSNGVNTMVSTPPPPAILIDFVILFLIQKE